MLRAAGHEPVGLLTIRDTDRYNLEFTLDALLQSIPSDLDSSSRPAAPRSRRC